MKLHLMCGARQEPGWINIDTTPPADMLHDVRNGLPFSNNTATHIFCEHGLEHLTREEGVSLLRECARVLKPDFGRIRISVPDLSYLVRRYLIGPLDFAEVVGWVPVTPAQMLNQGMRMWGHQFMYDADELKLVLREAGFVFIFFKNYQETRHDGMMVEGRPFLGEVIVEAITTGAHMKTQELETGGRS